jgi:hypothetical protein
MVRLRAWSRLPALNRSRVNFVDTLLTQVESKPAGILMGQSSFLAFHDPGNLLSNPLDTLKIMSKILDYGP